MKKSFNFRIPLCLACCAALGGAAGYYFVFFGLDLLWIIAIIPVTAVFFIFAALKENILAVVIIILAALIFAIGGVNTYTRLDSYSSHKLSDGETYTLCGTVSDKVKTETYEYVILKNASADGEKTDGKILAYLSEAYGEYCEIGDKVSFVGEVKVYALFPYGKLNIKAEKNVKYRTFVSGGMTTENGRDIFASARAVILNRLETRLDRQTAAIVFAMLTGITDGIEDETYDSLRYGGITHIFAVSGLHIGLVFGLLSLLCRLLKLNKYIAASVTLLPLFLYVTLCGFSVSSVRAFIMCAVYTASKLIYRKHDSLNALAESVILILLISPISLFSAGFQLSVCAVAGIFMLSKRIEKSFAGLNKKAASSLGVSLSAQLGTMPIMLLRFGYISGAGLLLNVVVVPILSLEFTLLFVSVLVACLFPFCSFLLPVAAAPLEAVTSFFVSFGFEDALVYGFGSGLFAVFYFLILLLLSDKLNLKSLYRGVSIIVAALFAVTYVYIRAYVPFNDYEVIVSANRGGGMVIIKSTEGSALIIEEYTDVSDIKSVLGKNYASSLKGVVILGGESAYLAAWPFDCDVFICDKNINLGDAHYEKNFEIIGASFEFIDGRNLIADCGGVTLGVTQDGNIESCNILISAVEIRNCECDLTAYFNLSGHRYNVYEYGDLRFKIDGGSYLFDVPNRA